MKRLYVMEFLDIYSTLVQVTKLPPTDAFGSKTLRRPVRRSLTLMAQHLQQIGASEHTHRLKTLARYLSPKSKVEWSDDAIRDELVALLLLIRHRLEHMALFVVSHDADLLSPRHPLFGAKVAKAFPDAKKDILQAHRCLVFDAPDASIYHSMMVLEYGLKAMAHKCGVDIGKNPWGNIIGRIRTHLHERTNQVQPEINHAEAEKKRLVRIQGPVVKIEEQQHRIDALNEEKIFLEACAQPSLEMRYFTNEWRNHVAHGRANYTVDEARKVLEHVGAFMTHLVSELQLQQVR